MPDLASLGISIDSGSLANTVDALDKLAAQLHAGAPIIAMRSPRVSANDLVLTFALVVINELSNASEEVA